MTEMVKQLSPKPEVSEPAKAVDTDSTLSFPLELHGQRAGTPSLLYQLRRIGAAASMQGVKDVFKLTKPRTIIGRNESDVDCFVDSSVHTRLISRQHAEILLEMDENQSPILYVLDKSLNGTFVNDVKIKQRKEDTWALALVFLEAQGLQPGRSAKDLRLTWNELAAKARKYRDMKNKTGGGPPVEVNEKYEAVLEAMVEESVEGVVGPEEEAGLPFPSSQMSQVTSHTKVPLKEGDTLTLGHLRGIQVKQGTHAEQQNSEFRFRLVYAPVEEDCTEGDENTPTKGKKKDSQKVSKKTRILHPPDSNVNSVTSQSANRAASIPPPFLQNNVHGDESESSVSTSAQKRKTRSSVESFSSHQDNQNMTQDGEENTQPLMNSDSWRGKPKRGRGRPSTRGSARGRGSTVGVRRGRGSTRGLGRGRGRGRGMGQGRGQGDSEKMETDEPVTLSREEARHGVSTSSGAAQEFQFEFESESGSEEDLSLHRQVDAICERDFENSDSESVKSKPGSSRPSSSKGKSSKNSGSSKSEPKFTDKKKGGGESASSTQGFRKKRSASFQKDDVPLAEFNSQPCSSPKCCRPLDSTVTWVQCDDCDDWYHVTCAGCDYNEVKRADYQFNCGCKPRKLKIKK